ncbi:flocculation-associated PEP-CTERM protein PepA [Neptunomonas qingdaonensis]|uniref:PEP-CTERM protein-sorting domain-containing protein n=1 Tax=Neptunomonas qingdaonensis TaxID=1045558 RepID=A0A1I2MYU4_9GAMM|nr:flocculation-associated PEP-CTERM protein PepA [Neptunomonas qingdaonensis]SFF94637.1 PEP-CTERM protein-sorting domain-containing protein [Neptunomonas qingdaonensis]
MKKLTKGLCLSTAIVAAGAMFSTSAMAGGIFTVNEGVVPGTVNALNPVPNSVTADEIIGNYSEIVEFTSATDFTVSIKFSLVGFELDNVLQPAYLSTPPVGTSGQDYGMYGTFLGSGTYSPRVGDPTVTEFMFSGGSYSLWIDPEYDTVFTSPGLGLGAGSTLWGTASDADDFKIATGAVVGGTGSLDPNQGGSNAGSFGTDLSVSLTDDLLSDKDGVGYFVAPDPFYNLALTSGDFEKFTVEADTRQAVSGKIGIEFNKVPEPATLALFGLGLAGMAGVARRKAKKQA